MKRCLVVSVLFISAFTFAQAQLRLASPFMDNAVLQQNEAINVWGEASPGKIVTVEFGDCVETTIAELDGRWMLQLPAQKGSFEPKNLIAKSCGDVIECKNVLVGEVWFASGQSNMDFRVGWNIKNMDEEIRNADIPGIRFLMTQYDCRPEPVDFIASGKWEVCSPETVRNFSAVSYFFAKNLYEDRKVPVGVIVSAIGATRIESWMSREGLSVVKGYKKHVDSYDLDQEKWDALVERINKANEYRGILADTTKVGVRTGVHKLGYNDKKWQKDAYPLRVGEIGYPGYWGMVWARKEFEMPKNFNPETKARIYLPVGATDDKIYINGQQVFHNISYHQDKSFDIEPGILNPGKNVIAVNMYITWGVGGIGDDMADCYIKSEDGTVVDLKKGYWKHSNAIEPPLPPYEDVSGYMGVNFNGMVNPYIPYTIHGFLWYQGEANSLEPAIYPALQQGLINDWRIRWKQGYLPFLYVQLANYCPAPETPVKHDNWAEFRDAQTEALDYSNNVGMACTIDIGETEDIHPKNKQEVGRRLYLIAKSQVYGDKDVEYSGPMKKDVKLEGENVRISYTHAEGLKGVPASEGLKGFALEDAKGRMIWADAYIDGEAVVVKIPKGFRPVKIQYAWSTNPHSSVYNGAGLPAVPFYVTIDK